MKNLLITLLLSLPFLSTAQTTFAPPGCEWYHNQLDGVFHSYYAGDTTISGISCRKVVRNAITKEPEHSMGLTVSDLHTLYVYNTTDTVFAYNDYFHRFTPLFIFNVHDGDTIHLPIVRLDFDYLHFINTDSTFSIKVDSVRMKLYDTALLKTVYTHPIGNSDTSYVYTYGAYAERLGRLYGGLIPTAEPSTNLTTESLQYPLGIRCYSDPTLSIKLVSGTCGLPPTQVAQLENNELPGLYPTPATNEITITAPTRITSISITNITGQTVHSRQYNDAKVNIDISTLPAGIYFVQTNGLQVQKLMKR